MIKVQTIAMNKFPRRMISKSIKILYIVLFVSVLLPAGFVRADTGPNPSMEFEFRQDLTGGPVTIVSGILFVCDQSDCSDAMNLTSIASGWFLPV